MKPLTPMLDHIKAMVARGPTTARECSVIAATQMTAPHLHRIGQDECDDMCEEWARDVFCIGNVLSDRIDAGERTTIPHEMARYYCYLEHCQCATCKKGRSDEIRIGPKERK